MRRAPTPAETMSARAMRPPVVAMLFLVVLAMTAAAANRGATTNETAPGAPEEALGPALGTPWIVGGVLLMVGVLGALVVFAGGLGRRRS